MQKFKISGMSCAACSARVEKAVSKLEGVEHCSVNLLTNSMEVKGRAAEEEIISAVKKAGYGAEADKATASGMQNKTTKSNSSSANEEIKKMKIRFFLSLAFLIVLLYISMGHMMWGWPLPARLAQNHVAQGILQLLLTVIIMVINRHFFTSGIKAALRLSPNMDTLVSLGSGASFIYSLYALFAMMEAQLKMDHSSVMSYMHEFYFESAAMILVLVTLGKMLEEIAKGKTTDALDKLIDLAPESATVVSDGKELSVQI